MDCTRHHDCANFSPMKCPNFTPKPAPRWPHPDKPDPTVVPPESRVVTEGWGVGSMPGRIPDGSSRSDRARALGYIESDLERKKKLAGAKRLWERAAALSRNASELQQQADDERNAATRLLARADVLEREAVELANKRYDDAKIIRDRKLAELDAL